jgi:hypothetical protein
MAEIPEIKPYKLKEYECKQSRYDCAPKLPVRDMLLGPSGGGKTVLLSNLILDIYKDCFTRIYIFSPSIHIDPVWRPVKDYIEKSETMSPNKHEQIYYDHYDPEALENIIHIQHQVADYVKNQTKQKKVYQILIIIDDFADSPEFTRQSKLLHSLFIRGRHTMISTIVATQVYKAISPIIRKNITNLYIFRLRNQSDLNSVMEEVSAVIDNKKFLELYKKVIDIPYSFILIKLTAKKIEDMFYHNFNKIDVLS